MLSKVIGGAVYGLDAYRVEVEVDISPGLPMFTIVGLPDASVKESKERVRAALKNAGFSFPTRRITVNLAPADKKKEGSAFDLPIALGILENAEAVRAQALCAFMIAGELSLDGRIKPVKGALPVALAAVQEGLKGLILPKENAVEAAVVQGIQVFGVETLSQAVAFLNDKLEIKATTLSSRELANASEEAEDFSEVKGQDHAKRALEVAAAGGHNLLMVGPPGSGKSMLAKRIPGILPPLRFEEALETTKIHSVMGFLSESQPLLTRRPFRSPHHSVSDAGLIGGGQIPKPGEVSLAHNGVLFLDELAEFRRNVLEMLRQPLEEGRVTISRAAVSLSYPAQFMLVAAMNPCPCGYFTDRSRRCICTPLQIQRYRSKVSGPLLDRIDIHLEVPAVPFKDLTTENPPEESSAIRQRVAAAKAVQTERYRKYGHRGGNAHLRPRQIKRYCALDEESQRLVEMAMNRLNLSARAYHRILKVARTIADLDGREKILPQDVSEAIQYRGLDRQIAV